MQFTYGGKKNSKVITAQKIILAMRERNQTIKKLYSYFFPQTVLSQLLEDFLNIKWM